MDLKALRLTPTMYFPSLSFYKNFRIESQKRKIFPIYLHSIGKRDAKEHWYPTLPIEIKLLDYVRGERTVKLYRRCDFKGHFERVLLVRE